MDLDTAYTLALLQEEADGVGRCEIKKPDYPFKPRQANTVVPLPLLPPPSRDKSLGGMPATEAKKSSEATSHTTSDNKIAALHAYRRAWGLCQYCAKKYSKGHKCAEQVHLHAVQKLWDLL
jgi:hypothetical protein